MIVLNIILALFFWVMLVGIVVTAPMWLSLLFIQLTGKSWKIGESSGGSDVPSEPPAGPKP